MLRKKISQSSRYGLFLITHYMWQSRVEIKDYSVVYFDRIAVFEMLYCRTSVKGGAHTRFVDILDVHASTNCE